MILQPPPGVQTHEVVNATLWFDKDGIMYSMPSAIPYIHLPREEAVKEVDKFLELTGGKKVYLIAEPHPGIKPLPKEDRDFVSEQLNRIMGAAAIVSTSMFQILILKTLFLFKPPAFPQNIFATEEAAKKWILEIKNNTHRKNWMVA